jgi:hypothetical protein
MERADGASLRSIPERIRREALQIVARGADKEGKVAA